MGDVSKIAAAGFAQEKFRVVLLFFGAPFTVYWDFYPKYIFNPIPFHETFMDFMG